MDKRLCLPQDFHILKKDGLWVLDPCSVQDGLLLPEIPQTIFQIGEDCQFVNSLYGNKSHSLSTSVEYLVSGYDSKIKIDNTETINLLKKAIENLQ